MKKLSLFFIGCLAIQSLSLAAITVHFRFNQNTPGLEDSADQIIIMPKWDTDVFWVLEPGEVADVNIPSLGSALEAHILYKQDGPVGYTNLSFIPESDGEQYDIPAIQTRGEINPEPNINTLLQYFASEFDRRAALYEEESSGDEAEGEDSDDDDDQPEQEPTQL